MYYRKKQDMNKSLRDARAQLVAEFAAFLASNTTSESLQTWIKVNANEFIEHRLKEDETPAETVARIAAEADEFEKLSEEGQIARVAEIAAARQTPSVISRPGRKS
jgi:phosphoglycolate phosphatase-like HAD superfamily hydrolase